MEMKKTLLEKCEEVIETTYWPFTKNNLKTMKVFQDLLQYHDSQGLTKTLLNTQSVDDSLMSHSTQLQKLNSVSGANHMRKASYQNGKHTAASGITGLTGFTNNSSNKFQHTGGVQAPFTPTNVGQNTTVFGAQTMNSSVNQTSGFGQVKKSEAALKEEDPLKLPNI